MLQSLKHNLAGNLFVFVLFPLFVFFTKDSFQKNFDETLGSVRQNLSKLAQTNRDQRLIETYGDREIMGFGYLLKVVRDIPDPLLFPSVRYHYYSMNEEVVFPGNRNKISKDILVGIDIRPEDLKESAFTDAVKIQDESTRGNNLTHWAFITEWDYARISGLDLSLHESLSGSEIFRARMLTSPTDPIPLGEWEWKNTLASNSISLHFDPPIKDQRSRGSLPYVLLLQITTPETQNPVMIKSLKIKGVKVSLEGYTAIHLEPTCFTALKTSFFIEIFKDRKYEWMNYILSLTNVPKVRAVVENARTTA